MAITTVAPALTGLEYLLFELEASIRANVALVPEEVALIANRMRRDVRRLPVRSPAVKATYEAAAIIEGLVDGLTDDCTWTAYTFFALAGARAMAGKVQ